MTNQQPNRDYQRKTVREIWSILILSFGCMLFITAGQIDAILEENITEKKMNKLL